MALIKCEECGKEISDKAEACPNCGYKNDSQKSSIKEDTVKQKPEKKSNKKKVIIIIALSMLVIALAVVLIIIFTRSKDSDSGSSSDKKEFADKALLIVKAAETAYVDNQATGDKAYTVSYLREKYISLDDNFEGCIIIKSDEDGNIDYSKKIYLTDGKYMTIGSSSADISSNYKLLIDEYRMPGSDSSWDSSYNYCNVGNNDVLDSEDDKESTESQDKNNNETIKSNDKSEKDKNTSADSKEKESKNEEEKSTDNSSTVTVGMKNALKSAKSYLSFSAFSRKGLIEQLEFEKYTTEEATYAVDNCGADWNAQALKSAKSYLSVSAFSYKSLKEQLEYEGFTSSQAKYGVDNCGANWKEQAAKSAKSYLSVSSFSRNGLIDQLEYEGFTHDQAVYGVDQAGL